MDKNTAGTALVAGAVGGLVVLNIAAHGVDKGRDSVNLEQVNDEETTTTIPIEESVPSTEGTTTTVLISTPPTQPPIVVSITPSGDVTPDQDATLEKHEERLDTLEATTTTSTVPMTVTTPPPTTTSILYG